MHRSLQFLSAVFFMASVATTAVATDLTVADLHAQRAEQGGKEISITGTVVKANNGIMGRNFIHIEDGTGSGDQSRVTFTSQETAKVGDKVTATGTVKLDVDFTMGYFYPTLVEDATFKPAQK